MLTPVAVWPYTGNAQTPAEPSTSINLQLQPALCAISKEERLCRKDVVVVWQLPEAASPCLHRSDLIDALHCWRQESQGEVQLVVETASDLSFVLKEGEHTLATTVFRVLWEEQQRRRRRKPWQFF